MRRLAVLAVFVLATFLPRLIAFRLGHVAVGFAARNGEWSYSGSIPSLSGDGPECPVRVALNVLSGKFSADLGGPVDAGSLHVRIAWSTTWFDKAGHPHTGTMGSFEDSATRLKIDAKDGRVTGHSAAISLRGPTLPRGGCGMGREARADHTIRFTRGGRRYRLLVSVAYTRRGNRVVTVDAGEGS